jgi:DNA-binding NarL/FixJ family response regulator
MKITVEGCGDAQQAIARLGQGSFDLVISDINLPDHDGFRVLAEAKARQPQAKTALITAYKVEDYVRLAKETGICNIIAKVAPFDFQELSQVVNNLLHPASCFGLASYLRPEAEVHQRHITHSDGIMEAFYALREYFTQQGVTTVDDLSTALIEALTNAVYHAAKHPDGTLKYQKGQVIEALTPDEVVTLTYGRDSQRIGVSISDQKGQISAQDILYWLDRNIHGAGLLDTHGRGVYLMHSLVDRLIINIAPGRQTEILILNYFSDTYRSNKPLYINQLS